MPKDKKPEKKHVPPFDLKLTFSPMKGLGGGFRQEWIAAEGALPKNGSFKAVLESGAGLGNPLLTFSISINGGDNVYYTADMRDLFRTLVVETSR